LIISDKKDVFIAIFTAGLAIVWFIYCSDLRVNI
jgi:hypothetical protein